jgi:hypothetical protein
MNVTLQPRYNNITVNKSKSERRKEMERLLKEDNK